MSFTDDAGNADTLTSAATAAVIATPDGICDRPTAVRNAILDTLSNVSDCATVTDSDLQGITGTLDLSSAGLTELQAGVFDDLSNLWTLNLAGNGLTELPDGIFAGLTNLQMLYLSENKLTELPNGIFDILPNLLIVELAGNELTELPASIFDLNTHLRQVNLTDNELTELPDGIFDNQLDTLATLSLSGNDLSPLPDGFLDRFNRLQFLHLADTGLTELPDGFFDNPFLAGLVELHLNSNGLTELPDDVFDGLIGLERLTLGENDLSELPDGVFDELLALEGLALYGNRLQELPDGVFDDLANLNSIRLDGNDLGELPDGVFDDLTNLKYLSLGDNDLSELPDGVFDDLTALEWLSLEDNRLLELPDGVFDDLANLKHLSLGDNDLSELPHGVFDDLANLKHLSLGDNDLSELPDGVFDDLTALEWLSLENNRLQELPEGVFDDLISLEELWLGNNDLSELPVGVFGALAELTGLKLYGNGLEELPDGVFEGLANLSELGLSGNPGAPFAVTAELEHRASDLVVNVPLATPVDLRLTLSANGGAFSTAGSSTADTVEVVVKGGSTTSGAVTVTRNHGQSPLSVSVQSLAFDNDHFISGIEAKAGPSLAWQTQANGTPTISGKVKVGETLQAGVTGITDPDGTDNATFTYQWIANDGNADADIQGATSSSYTLTDSEEGKTIKVRVSFTDDGGNAETSTSPVTASVASSAQPDTLSYLTVVVTEDESDPDNVVSTFTMTWNDEYNCSDGYNAYLLPVFGDVRSLGSAVSQDEQIVFSLTNGDPTGGARDALVYCGTYESGSGRPVSFGTKIPVYSRSFNTVPVSSSRLPVPGTYSNEPGLTSLSVSRGTLTPAFHSQTLSYTVPGAIEDDEQVTITTTEKAGYTVAFYRDEGSGRVYPKVSCDYYGQSCTAYVSDGYDNRIEPLADIDDATAGFQVDLPEHKNYFRLMVHVYLNNDPGRVYAINLIAPTNTPSTGAPAITGSTHVGETLTADISGIADADGLSGATFSYQWIANDGTSDTDITGATDSTYILATTDEGKTIKVRVSFTDDAGNDESLTSTATEAVAAAEPQEPPAKPRNLQVVVNHDGTVTLTWDDPGDDSITGYQILRRNRDTSAIGVFEVHVEDTGSAATSYIDRDVTPETRYNYRVKARNESGLSVRSNFVKVDTPSAQNSPASGAPSIGGTFQVGETLTAETTGIADADGLTNVSYSYQWLANDGTSDTDITGATGSDYTLAASDEGKTVMVRVSFTDDSGNDESLTSTATVAVAAAEPQEPPAIPRNLEAVVNEDGTVTLTWDDPGDDSITGYQILRRNRDTSAIGVFEVHVEDTGSAATSYVDRDVTPETLYNYRVKARNESGLSRRSNYVKADIPSAQNSPASGAPTIRGTAQVGETLTAGTLGITDDDGLTNVSYSYHWVANDGSSGADITGAPDSTYTLADADEGKTIKVRVSFTDDAGNEESLTSPATAAVATAAPTSRPSKVLVDGPEEMCESAPDVELSALDDLLGPPGKPSRVLATYVEGGVELLWRNDSRVTGYRVWRASPGVDDCMSPLVVDTGSTYERYVDAGVSSDAAYGYRVQSLRDTAVGEWSEWTLAEVEAPPAAPTGLTGTVYHDQVSLNWDDPRDDRIRAYQVLRAERVLGKDGDFLVLVPDTRSAATSYVDRTVAAGAQYVYRIKARNRAGLGEQSEEFYADTPQPPAVTVSFKQARYSVGESESESISVTLNVDPQRTVLIPITVTNQGDTSDADYAVLIESVTFNRGDIEQTFEISASDDEDDDDGESVLLKLGASLPDRVSAGRIKETTVSIADTDNPSDADATRDGALNLGNITDLTYPRSITGTVSKYDDRLDYYKFKITRSRFVTVKLESLDVDAGLYLEDTLGRKLKIRDSSWTSHRWFEIPVEKGTYFIKVKAVEYGANSYILRYRVDNQSDDYTRGRNTTGSVGVNGSSTGNIEFTGDRDWFTADLTAGKTYWIEHKGSPTDHGTLTDTAITGIHDSDGEPIRWTSDDDSGVRGNARVVFTPVNTGTYYIEASADKRIDWDGLSVAPGAQGTYTLFLSEYISDADDDHSSFTDTTGEIEVGSWVRSEIETVGDQDWFAVDLTANRTYRFSASGAFQTSGQFTLEQGKIYGIYDAHGNAVSDPVDMPRQMRWEFLPRTSGKYFISMGGNDLWILGSNQQEYDDYHSDPNARYQMIGTYQLAVTEESEYFNASTPATGAPIISGTAQVGETLTADTSGIEDADGLEGATFSYQWSITLGTASADIPGATEAAYIPTATDEGKTIRVRVSFTDDAGYEETLTSAATSEVAARPNSPASGVPTISGTAQVGETLAADTSGIGDADGLDNWCSATNGWLTTQTSQGRRPLPTPWRTPTGARPSRCGWASKTTQTTTRV